ncbi:MAG: two-component sensor histidine kinase, partial [Verrucomicrobiota bacterium]
MSSNRLKNFHRTLSFRLSFWFALIFTASAAVLFVISYFLLSASIERKDREIVQDRARQYAA